MKWPTYCQQGLNRTDFSLLWLDSAVILRQLISWNEIMAGHWQWILGEVEGQRHRTGIAIWIPHTVLPGTHTANWHPLFSNGQKYRKHNFLEKGHPEDLSSITNPRVLASRSLEAYWTFLMNVYQLWFGTKDATVSYGLLYFLPPFLSPFPSVLQSNTEPMLCVWRWVYSVELERHCPHLHGFYNQDTDVKKKKMSAET